MRDLFTRWVVFLLLGNGSALAVQAGAEPPPSEGVATGSHPPAVERRLDRWFHDAMELIYQGRPTCAARIADAMQEAAPDDPRPYLLRARVLRLDVSDQNFERQVIREEIAPIDEQLDLAIEAAERLLERDPSSIAGRLYRGWGLMFQSQLRALSYDYWDAGQKARAGKANLERVLELAPGNPDAQLLRGSYLYFAGILPGVVKLASMIVGIPGGDMADGIEGISYAATRHGYGQHDARALLGVVYFGFEGRLEDAARRFEAINAAFPDNARILEPLALIDLFVPQRLGQNLARTTRAVRITAESPEPFIRKIAARLRLYEALSELLMGRIDLARSNLEKLLEDVPDQPDWLETAAKLTLADLDLMQGDRQSAMRMRDRSARNPDLRKRLSYLLSPDAAADQTESDLLLALQPIAQMLYSGELASAETQIATLEAPGNPMLEFYRGELAILRGQPKIALRHFEKITRSETAARHRLFRFFAFAREAEAHGMLGQNGDAADALQEAIEFHADRDLMRHVAKARRRYFENEQPGAQRTGSEGRKPGQNLRLD